MLFVSRSSLWRLGGVSSLRGRPAFSSLWRSRVWRFPAGALRERRRPRSRGCRRGAALSFWFRVCCFLGRGFGSLLAAPFFRRCVPPCWSWLSSGRWVRRWPAACCGLRRFGFSGRWVCLSAAALPALRLRCFVWSVFPAVVSRRGGVVFSVWAFVSPAPEGAGEIKKVVFLWAGSRCRLPEKERKEVKP